MNITIDKSFLGTEKNLLLYKIENSIQYSWTDKKEFYHLKDKNSTFFKLLAIISENLNEILPSQKYIRMMNTFSLDEKSIIPWGNILSEKDKIEYNKKIINHISNVLKDINENNLSYFNNILSIRENFLNSLNRFYIDEEEINKILSQEKNKNSISTLQNFYFSNEKIIKYNNFGSRTGRLTVDNDLNILTLKKEYRKIFKSEFGDNGQLIAIDFSSLEVRLLLLEAGKSIKNFDIYQKISDGLKNILDREQVKKLLISFIYGASNEKLASICEVDISIINDIILSLKRNLNIENLLLKIKSKINNNKIENKLGRLIKLENNSNDDGIILNYYIQSLGADFSIVTFYNFLNNLNTPDIKPIFIIHDSLVLDVHNSNLNNISNLDSIFSEIYKVKFPVKITNFLNGNKI